MSGLRWTLFVCLASVGCDSPQVVSFNTPELCSLNVTGIRTFSDAEEQCEGDCRICIETVRDDYALTYGVSYQDECVCTPPRVETLVADAGADGNESQDAGEGDAGAAREDGGLSSYRPADGCTSRLRLSETEARQHCAELEDCRVCVERVDYEGDPRSYLAHQCGCPAPHRVDPQ